ncbi:diaminopimelate decarboxylase [bacterium]|nr:diaminopimelate decarboxylase [bacterium]
MHHFQYHDEELYCEDIPVRKIIQDVGTPVYIYSRRTLEHHARVYEGAFEQMDHLSCFAIKANSNLSVIRLFAGNGMGADVVSGGEIFRALKAGVPPDRIVFAGVGKTKAEMAYALRRGILMFNCESSAELDLLDSVARDMNKKAPVAIRVNPDIDASTHPYISTGLEKNKFGLNMESAFQEYLRAKEMKGIEITGMHTHIGSQITEIGPFRDAVDRIKGLIERISGKGLAIRNMDIGGGLGIRYRDETPPTPAEWAQTLIPVSNDLGCRIISEPGRVLVGNAGVLVTRVLYLKNTSVKRFAIVDAGMNDLIRPSLYQSYHDIWPVCRREGEVINMDIVGPICESGDFFARDRAMTMPMPNDLLAVMSAGAYGFTMSSNYNSRPRSAEVMVDGGEFMVVRGRETYEDLIRGETV